MMNAAENALPDLLRIEPFTSQDQEAVKRLILEGMEEHWGQLDYSKNRDLEDIQSSYKNGLFLVTRLNGKIIGCGALIARGDGIGEIVRMSVAKPYRRSGVGRKILASLVDQAGSRQFQKIILETTSTWHEVIAFYLKFGFKITHEADGDTYFSLDIG